MAARKLSVLVSQGIRRQTRGAATVQTFCEARHTSDRRASYIDTHSALLYCENMLGPSGRRDKPLRQATVCLVGVEGERTFYSEWTDWSDEVMRKRVTS